jgi:hypothetical protein
MRLVRLVGIPGSLFVACVVLVMANAASAASAVHASIDCEYSSLCAEVADPASVFGLEYVGHDEPSAVF